MKLLLRVLVLASAACVAYGLCNVCKPIGLACVSTTMYKNCVNGVPTGNATSCPAGEVCSEGTTVCAAPGTAPGSCSSCGLCNANGTFACTGYNTFALCYGTSIVSSANYTCSGSLVCNIDSATICIDPLAIGLGGTCPSVSSDSSTSSSTSSTSTTTVATTISTPSPVNNSDAYCAWKGAYGRFDVTSDSTCKSYIYCVLYGGVWRGTVMQCVGQTLFNATSGLCQVGTPSRCASVQ